MFFFLLVAARTYKHTHTTSTWPKAFGRSLHIGRYLYTMYYSCYYYTVSNVCKCIYVCVSGKCMANQQSKWGYRSQVGSSIYTSTSAIHCEYKYKYIQAKAKASEIESQCERVYYIYFILVFLS